MGRTEREECMKCEELENAFIAVRTEALALVLSGHFDEANERLDEFAREEDTRRWALLEHKATEH